MKVFLLPFAALELGTAACSVLEATRAALGVATGANRSVAGSGIGGIPSVPGGTLKVEPISSWLNSNIAVFNMGIAIQESHFDGRVCRADDGASAGAMMAVQG